MRRSRGRVLDLARDVGFGWHEWTWARLQSRTGRGKAYVYYFSKRPPYPDLPAFKGLGAIHTAEEPYMFNNLVLKGYQYTDADRALADEMSSYWVNFAKTATRTAPDCLNGRVSPRPRRPRC